jgi:hypothetical protein
VATPSRPFLDADAALMEREGEATASIGSSGSPDESLDAVASPAGVVAALAEAGEMSGPPVVEQIAQGIELATRQPGRAVRLVLQPDGLGSMSLRVGLSETGTGVQVHIAVDSAATRELVQTGSPQLAQALDQHGLSVDRLLVELSGSRAQDAGSGQQHARQQPAESRPTPRGGGRQAEIESIEIDPSPKRQRVDYRV